MARNKNVVKESVENAVETVEPKIVEPQIVEPDNDDSDDSVVNRVVSKVKQVITLKKVLTERQQAHLNKLALARLGKKTTYKEIPIEEVPLKVKKVKVKVPEPVVPVVPVVPVKAVRKARIKVVPVQVQEPIKLTRFNKNLF